MPKQNPYLIKENKAQVVEIREIENYQPNWFTKTFLSTTYCCKNSLCGCDCLSDNCVCAGGVKSLFNINDGFRIANSSSFGRVKEGSVGWNGRSGESGVSAIRIKDHTGDAKFLSVSVGGEIVDENNVKFKAGVDVANLKVDGFQARVGLNIDSGISNGSDGVEAKLAGFGVTYGNQVGISTPIGEVKVDKDKCVVQ